MKKLKDIYSSQTAFGNKELIKRTRGEYIVMVECPECNKIKPVQLRKSFTNKMTQDEAVYWHNIPKTWCEECF